MITISYTPNFNALGNQEPLFYNCLAQPSLNTKIDLHHHHPPTQTFKALLKDLGQQNYLGNLILPQFKDFHKKKLNLCNFVKAMAILLFLC